MNNLKREVTLQRKYNQVTDEAKRAENYCKATKSVCTNLNITDEEISFIAYSNITYEQLVNKLVAEKYTIQDELAIQRKAYNGLTDEYYIYNAYVEDCKTRAKEFVKERNETLGVVNNE